MAIIRWIEEITQNMQVGTIVSIFISALALSLAIRSQIKQRRLQDQLDRKQELEGLAESLDELKHGIEYGIQLFKSPTSHEDLRNQLEILSNAVISYNHTKDRAVTLIPHFYVWDGEERQYITDSEEAIEKARSGKSTSLNITIVGAEDVFEMPTNYSLGQPTRHSKYVFDELDGLETENDALIQEFSPGLIEETDELMANIYRRVAESIISKEDGYTIDPEEYSSATEVREAIYNDLLFYDGLEEDLEEVESQVQNIEDVRKSLLQTSYS